MRLKGIYPTKTNYSKIQCLPSVKVFPKYDKEAISFCILYMIFNKMITFSL